MYRHLACLPRGVHHACPSDREWSGTVSTRSWTALRCMVESLDSIGKRAELPKTESGGINEPQATGRDLLVARAKRGHPLPRRSALSMPCLDHACRAGWVPPRPVFAAPSQAVGDRPPAKVLRAVSACFWRSWDRRMRMGVLLSVPPSCGWRCRFGDGRTCLPLTESALKVQLSANSYYPPS